MLTLGGSDRQCSGNNAQCELLQESHVYAGIDRWNSATAVIAGLHGVLFENLLVSMMVARSQTRLKKCSVVQCQLSSACTPSSPALTFVKLGERRWKMDFKER